MLHDLNDKKLTARKVQSDIGEHPRLHRETVYMPLNKLSVVWIRAQRPFDLAWATLIAENFDKDMFEDVVITKPDRNGVSHIIEGQHRVAAVEIKWGRDELVPCRIVAASDPARAAEIWIQINNGKKKARPVDHFHVMVTAKNDEAVQIERILKECGLIVGPKARGHVSCVAALQAVYRMKVSKDQVVGEVLDYTLAAMVAIWGPTNNQAYGATLVKSFGLFAKSYWADIDWQRLTDTIKRRFFNPDELIAAGRHNRERTLMRGVCRELVMTYNYKKTGARLKLEDL